MSVESKTPLRSQARAFVESRAKARHMVRNTLRCPTIDLTFNGGILKIHYNCYGPQVLWTDCEDTITGSYDWEFYEPDAFYPNLAQAYVSGYPLCIWEFTKPFSWRRYNVTGGCVSPGEDTQNWYWLLKAQYFSDRRSVWELWSGGEGGFLFGGSRKELPAGGRQIVFTQPALAYCLQWQSWQGSYFLYGAEYSNIIQDPIRNVVIDIK